MLPGTRVEGVESREHVLDPTTAPCPIEAAGVEEEKQQQPAIACSASPYKGELEGWGDGTAAMLSFLILGSINARPFYTIRRAPSEAFVGLTRSHP